MAPSPRYTVNRVPTQIFNGYKEQVKHLYKHLKGQDQKDLWH